MQGHAMGALPALSRDTKNHGHFLGNLRMCVIGGKPKSIICGMNQRYKLFRVSIRGYDRQMANMREHTNLLELGDTAPIGRGRVDCHASSANEAIRIPTSERP
jgi:hypothetical protein